MRMIPSQGMATQILCIAGPTASGKSSRAVEEALKQNGEIISVDSRQVYRGLNIGTEKITREEMCGVSSTNGLVLDVPHHLIDIRDPRGSYSAGDFVVDAAALIRDMSGRGKLPILVGGTHFYFDALLSGLPLGIGRNQKLREQLETLSTEELFARIREQDPRRAAELDPHNRRRLVRALEIVETLGFVPERMSLSLSTVRNKDIQNSYKIEWIVIDPPREELRARIDARLQAAFVRGLVDEVRWAREEVGDVRLNELGLEYKIVGEFLRGERTEESLLPALSAKLWQYARRQKAWLRKLQTEIIAYSSI